MNEMLPESTRCVTGSAVNMGWGKRLLLSEGWRDEMLIQRTRWSYRSDDGLPVTLLEKFANKNLLGGDSFKKNGIFWEFFPKWGGVTPIPKTFCKLPSHFWHAKFILRC